MSKQAGYEQFFKKRKEIHNKKVTKSKNNWGLMVLACVMAAGSGWYLYVGDKDATQFFGKLFDSVEVSLMGEASAEEKPAETKEKPEEKSAAPTVEGQPTVKKSWTEDEINLFNKLEARKSQLDGREAELAKLEEELQKQKGELEKRLAELNDVRSKISAKLDDRVKTDGQKVDSLVSVYANMKPAQAAKVIEGINEDLAVEVLAKMKNKNAAEILNLMDSDKAKKISEKFAGFREPANR